MFVLDFSGPYTGPDYASDSFDSDSSRARSRSPSPFYDVTMMDESETFKFASPVTNSDPNVSMTTTTPTSPRPSSSSSLFSVSSSDSTCTSSDLSHNVISGTVWVETFLDTCLRMPRLECLFLLGVKQPADGSGYTHDAICGAGLGFRQAVEEIVEECEGDGEQCQFRGLHHDEQTRSVCGGSRTRLSFIVKNVMRDGWWWEDMGRSGTF